LTKNRVLTLEFLDAFLLLAQGGSTTTRKGWTIKGGGLPGISDPRAKGLIVDAEVSSDLLILVSGWLASWTAWVLNSLVYCLAFLVMIKLLVEV
jgi:hypothetical protein